jgi:serine/threonine-protein kinase
MQAPGSAHASLPASTGQAAPLAATASDLAATVAMAPQVALVQPGRMLGPYGTTLVDQATGRPIQHYGSPPPSSHEMPRIYDESSTGPPSHEVKTQIYRPRGASAMPFPPELPSQVPPQPAPPAPAPQPSNAKTYALITGVLILLGIVSVGVLMYKGYLPGWSWLYSGG